MKPFFFVVFFIFSLTTKAQKIAVVKYDGGGDWYANETALPNLISYCNDNIKTTLDPKPEIVRLDHPALYTYPYIHITGHGNIVFSDHEITNLKNYLLGGGLLHIDDNYGLDKYIRREINKVFPNNQFIELPISHPIFKEPYSFPQGTPKIHVHDGKKPQTYAILNTSGRIMVLYTYETDLGNGWEDQEIHNDPQKTRLKALQMGANIITYSFSN